MQSLNWRCHAWLVLWAVVALASPVTAQSPGTVRVTGKVIDQTNAITLPGAPVEVIGGETVFTDVDGNFAFDLPAGSYELKISMDGYVEQRIKVDVQRGRPIELAVSLPVSRFSETVTVTAQAVDAQTASAEVQLIERKSSPVITDNMGSLEMRANGDSDAASALTRVTGLSLVDNQYVYVRGLGERYSNTTLGGATIPTTEPDKKVIPLDLFPTGLVDSVQVAKTYTPDKSAEFAGGLVQIQPLKFPNRPVFDLSYGLAAYTNATGKSIPLSPLGRRDFWGFDRGARALPSSFPDGKIVRAGIYTPDVGFSRDQITQFGRQLENRWRPVTDNGAPAQNWGVVFGQRAGKFGVVASASHSYREQYIDEVRRFYRIADDGDLEAVSDYAMQSGTQRAQLGVVANFAYNLSTNHRLGINNFYTHSGRDEGRVFEGPNTENNFIYRNNRVQFIEEELLSNGVVGDHFLQSLANSRLDWRVSYARAARNEPDLRETLYQQNLDTNTGLGTGIFRLSDESQSGFRMFNDLNDDSLDAALNWAALLDAGGTPVQLKVGGQYVERTRDFRSRRFRFIPTPANTGGVLSDALLSATPEEIFTSSNIGTSFRFNEETRPVDAYDGTQTTTSGYGMVDAALSTNTRLIAGVRLERFDLEVNTFDPFGLFIARVDSTIRQTNLFPGVNVVYSLRPETNLRLSYSTTVNRPEFRELAPFEFTDVVGSRAVTGNPNLQQALIQNVDGRLELFSGARGVFAASVFFKHFDKPIERTVIAGAQPIVTFQNADTARNVGFELEAARQLTEHIYVNANYTYVDSRISLRPEQRQVLTSLERPLAGQSKNLFNGVVEFAKDGFSTRLLYNFFDDRISDVGSNQAPDIVENGRTALDLTVSQRVGRMNLRFTAENLTDVKYRFLQGTRDQRLYQVGRTLAFSVGYNFF